MTERYRIENGEPCIDVKAQGIEQLFDNRDPAPFRERDLDPDLADYLLDAGEDLERDAHIRVVFWLDKPCQPTEIEQAYRAHFEFLIEKLRRQRQRRRRTGQAALGLAIVLITVLLSLGQLVDHAVGGSLGTGLKEGLVISAWVVMWRPIESLVYDWIPQRRERKIAEHLLDAPVDVRTGRAAELEERRQQSGPRLAQARPER